MKSRILIIRFSSLGDVVQCLAAVSPLQQAFPKGEVHLLTRNEFAEITAVQPGLQRIFGFSRQSGLIGLIRLALKLRQEGYTHIYDAHNNSRSRIVTAVLRLRFQRPLLIRRSKERWKQILLYKFRQDHFERPRIAQKTYISPLAAWGVGLTWEFSEYWKTPQIQPASIPAPQSTTPYVVLVPSTAHALKDWPLKHWLNLIDLLANRHFVVLGGSKDTHCQRLADHAPNRVLNLAGQTSLAQSCAWLGKAVALVAADTGLLHVADASGVPAIALYGPVTCCYPSAPTTKVLEIPLPCRPCSRIGEGYCTHPQLKKCMSDILPEHVADAVNKILETKTE